MQWNDITTLHVEITTMCNAVCPGCARYPTASYFSHPRLNKLQSWTTETVRQKLPVEDIKHIKTFFVNGTVGDFIANKDALEIIEYIRSAGVPNISINTNGGARDQTFWEALGKLRVTVNFALDGLEDTHSLYRREINFATVIDNAKSFIQAGGNAVWIMTVFEHNKHQIDACRRLSVGLGFKEFIARQNDRGIINVFDRSNQLAYTLTPSVDSDTSHRNRNTPIYNKGLETRLKLNTVISSVPESIPQGNVVCHSKLDKSVYITGDWSVVPCCFIGNAFIMDYLYEYKDLQQKVSGIDNARVGLNQLTVKQSWEAMNNWTAVYETINNETGCSICKIKCTETGDWIIGKTTAKKM